jgi:hypothetical protein
VTTSVHSRSDAMRRSWEASPTEETEPDRVRVLSALFGLAATLCGDATGSGALYASANAVDGMHPCSASLSVMRNLASEREASREIRKTTIISPNAALIASVSEMPTTLDGESAEFESAGLGGIGISSGSGALVDEALIGVHGR